MTSIVIQLFIKGMIYKKGRREFQLLRKSSKYIITMTNLSSIELILY